MAKFGLFGSNKGQAIQEFEGERIFNSANPPGFVEIKSKDNQTVAVMISLMACIPPALRAAYTDPNRAVRQ